MNDPHPNARRALADLIAAWFHCRPLTSILKATFEPVDVPARLAETITCIEPYRSQALADAAVYLSLPYLAGFGLEFVPEVRETAPFESWAATYHPFPFRLTWTLHLDGREPHVQRETWQRVAFEDGLWKIVQFWDEEDRRNTQAEIGRIKHYIANRCGV